MIIFRFCAWTERLMLMRFFTESLSEYVDKESLQIYLKSRQILDRYKSAHKDFLQSADTKKFRFECQKAINIPVNAISGVSEQHLKDKYNRLQSFLTGKSSPNVMQHPQGMTYCKDHLAKKLVVRIRESFYKL